MKKEKLEIKYKTFALTSEEPKTYSIVIIVLVLVFLAVVILGSTYLCVQSTNLLKG